MIRRFAALLLAAASPALAQDECGARLFVSGFNSTVHVFDACTGQYLRNLDTPERLAGAMAVRLGPDGLLYAVAESTGFIHKYRNDTLEYAGVFAQVGGIGATGLAFDAAGIAYVAGYSSDDVKRYDRGGAALGPAFPARSSGLNGPDNGLTFGPDGNLYVPSYDTSSVVRWDPRTGLTSVAVAARTAGLLSTRGLLPARDGTHMFITSEGSGTVLRWNLASGAVAVFASGLNRPTGIDYAPDGALLVSSGDAVLKLDAATGARLATFVESGAGGIAAQVFVAVIAKPAAAAIDTAQVGTQYWVVGDGAFSGRVLELSSVLSATGTGFGANLRFAELSAKRWGTVRMELVSCTQARFSWDSTGAGSAGFGSGGYDVVRYFENEGTERCRAQGLDHPDRSWVNGQWWGGSTRSGEGWFVDRGADGRAFFAWFTHRPGAGVAADATQVGTQYWVVGDARIEGRTLRLDNVYSATGTGFGPALDFTALAVKRWGSARIELTSCTEAVFSWDSTGAASAGFGSGSYPVYRYFENEDTARCRQQGLDAADRSWINGQWWGRDARAGEGLFVDRASDGRVFLAWFTHRPR
jgi:DNA-binding beta-propeller fold protein YncE